ncbi:hypothetical protein ABW20_dc0101840 [Dactylellina cionopaga]|nr:hypothetical protein ABW20_dc0101840 [Dactylellina cionopaga]
MGGSAFAVQGLLTPRLTPRLYRHLKAQHHTILTGLYGHVMTPPEGPGKNSYGDIDFLVAEPLPRPNASKQSAAAAAGSARRDVSKPSRKPVTTMEDVKAAFGAEYSIGLGVTTSFAILRDPEPPMSWEIAEGTATKGNEEKLYAQIDVHVCPSAENMRWMAFKHSYGDMWSILGMMARAKGLVADEKCLSLRVKEIEKMNKALAKVELTRDVNETLEFFGLDAEVYAKGFERVQLLYEYIMTSRFFEEKYFQEKGWRRSHDKHKLGKREVMKGFFVHLGVDVNRVLGDEDEETEISDGEKEEDEEMQERITREQVLEEALEKFGKRAIYEEKVRVWRRNLRVDTVVRGVVKGLITDNHKSPRSARKKASLLRKQFEGGELEEVFGMTEEDTQKFVDARLEEIVKEININSN